MNANETQSKNEVQWAPTWQYNIKTNTIVFILDTIVKCMQLTIRKLYINQEKPYKMLAANEGFILGMWHENMTMVSRILKPFKLNILASASKDGEVAVRYAARAGHVAQRGSSSRFGGQALKKLIRIGKQGGNLAIMPDGPRGPFRKAHAGVVSMAQLTGLPIIPFHYSASRQYRFERSWDGHKFAKPFSTIVSSWGNPIYVPKKMSREEFQEQILKVERLMNENAQMTERICGDLAKFPYKPFVPLQKYLDRV